MMRSILGIVVLGGLGTLSSAFVPPSNHIIHNNRPLSRTELPVALTPPPSFVPGSGPKSQDAPSSQRTASSSYTLRQYQHKDWTLTYRYKAAAKGHEHDPPLLLVHPVGIGMSSWYWNKFLDEWQGGAVYAPDLIGCGLHYGSDAWKPNEQGLFFPLGWVQGLETLLQTVILPEQQQQTRNPLSSLWMGDNKNNNNNGCTVVTQGGLAPVGVMLAARNPSTVSQLVMTSPPTWKEMTTAVPEQELESNYQWLSSNLGNAAFGALEQAWAIRFFSNLFLIQGEADDEWMAECLAECKYQEARPPIQAFNAGLLQHRSYGDELTSLVQPTTIVQGADDAARHAGRTEYDMEVPNGHVVTLPQGKSVLPWECPGLFAELLVSTQQPTNRATK